ncbi:MAG: DNA polymerase IV [Bacteroidetes bacterium]|jgi:DNA polymerase-4|nr:DNA polymerase IV [Bacteroidota bacterium]
MKKHIAHMDLDSFFVSVERLRNRAFQNIPLVIGGTGDRGVVASCSYEARAFGVRSAMSVKMARQLCPNAVFIRGDHELYSQYSRMVTNIVAESVPVYEKSSIDEFYLDLSGMDRFFGCWQIAKELGLKINRETGLPISFGLSANKTVSKIATGEAKPAGARHILHGTEKPFLAPLSIRKIPGVGQETYKTLRGLGIQRIETIQAMPAELMEKTLGKTGSDIWKKSQGIDHNPVEPYREQKSISTEQTFEQDTIDVQMLKSLIVGMAENLAYQLRKQNKVTGCVTIKIRYSDFNTYTRQLRIPYTSADHTLIAHSCELFEKLYEKRMLVRLIGIRFSELVTGSLQINLFEHTEEMINLYQAMDKIRNRYGDDAVKRAISNNYNHPPDKQ